jgi:mono/diheme cytochrome c family protein
MKKNFAFAIFLLLLTACQLEGIQPLPPNAPPDPVLGQRLFQQNRCVGCHNYNASGGLAAEASDLRGTSLSYLAVLKQVRAPKGQMPARAKDDVSDAEVTAIYAWLQTFPKQSPTPDKSAGVFPTPIPEVVLATPTATPLPPTLTPTLVPTLRPNEPTPTPAPPTATPLPPTPTKPPVDLARLIAAQQVADDLKVAADYAKDATTNLNELRSYVNTGLTAAQNLQKEVNAIRSLASGAMVNTLSELQPHLDTYLKAAQNAAQANDFNAGKKEAATMVLEARVFVLPLAQQLIVDAGRVGTVRGRITNQQGQGIANAVVTIAFGRYKRGVATDANGLFTAANIPAIKPLEVKAYASGFIYHEQNTELTPNSVATVNITLPRQGSDAPKITVGDFVVNIGANSTTLRMKATHPQNNLAEDQIFALNPQLGIAVVLLPKGNDLYETTIPLAARGRWLFFAVDHQCFASNIATVESQ